jgi:hypothetical protein
MEDAPIAGFSVDSNIGNTADRLDLLVANLEYIPFGPQTPATYSIIKGPVGNPVRPALTDPDTQIVLGVIKVFKAGINPFVLNGPAIEYEKERCPDSGDGTDARLDSPNAFKRINMQAEAVITLTNAGEPTDHYTLPKTANTFRYSADGEGFKKIKAFKIDDVGAAEDGTAIEMYVNGNLHFMQVQISTQNTNLGYRGLGVPASLQMGTHEGAPVITTRINQPVILRFLKINGFWYITSITKFYQTTVAESGGYKIHFSGSVNIGDCNGTDELKTITFATMDAIEEWEPFPDNVTDAVHVQIIGNLRSVSGNWNQDNDITFTIREKSMEGFKLALREFNSNVQNLRFDFIVVIPA